MRPSGRGGRRQIMGCDAPAQDIGDGGVLGGALVRGYVNARQQMVVCTFLHTKGETAVLSVQNNNG